MGYASAMALDIARRRFLTWLLTPPSEREPATQGLVADELGTTAYKLNKWKEEAEFLKEWEREYLRTVGNPEVKMKIMQALEQIASDPDAQAAIGVETPALAPRSSPTTAAPSRLRRVRRGSAPGPPRSTYGSAGAGPGTATGHTR